MELFRPFTLSYEALSALGHELLSITKSGQNDGKLPFRLLLNIEKHLDCNLLEHFKGLGLTARTAELFYYPPGVTSMIHIDGDEGNYIEPGNMAKINYISDSKDSQVFWYTPLIKKEGTIKGTPNKYMSFKKDEVQVVAGEHLTGYNIVQTGIPHNVKTRSETRYCVSIVFVDNRNKFMPFEMMAEIVTGRP